MGPPADTKGVAFCEAACGGHVMEGLYAMCLGPSHCMERHRQRVLSLCVGL